MNAYEPMKAAWQWTLDERIELRLDPALMRERVAASQNADDGAGRRRLQAAGFAKAASPFLVEGARNPELLMPSELFFSIIDAAAATEHERKRYSARVRGRRLNGGEPERLLVPQKLSNAARAFADVLIL